MSNAHRGATTPLRLCHKSVHGSTSSPRTDHSPLEISYLTVRPEPVEGQTANYDTVSLEGGKLFESELSSWVIMANPTERR